MIFSIRNLIAYSSLLFWGCSTELPKNESELDFYMDREGTVNGTIFLNLDVGSGDTYLVAFDSASPNLQFIAGPDNPKAVTGAKQIPITATEPGEYTFEFQLFSKDGTAIASDQFSFLYQSSTIEDPVIGFSEPASQDAFVKIRISDARSVTVDQIWIEGDVTDPYRSRWLAIDSLDEVFIEMTPGQGMKYFQIKARGIYGAESSFIGTSLLVDGETPLNCAIELASDVFASPFAYMRLSGDDNEQLEYSVVGDVASFKGLQPFENGDKVYVELAAGSGEKTIRITLSDSAGNTCLSESYTVTVDPSHNPIGISITGNPIYTFEQQIELNLRIDTFELEAYQVHLSGGIMDQAEVGNWVPYQEKITVNLAPEEGNRFVYMKILENGAESKKVHVNTYLNPKMKFTVGTPYQIHLPGIIETESVTITGCVESIVNIDYAASISCTPSAAAATATLYFNNGTTLVLQENF